MSQNKASRYLRLSAQLGLFGVAALAASVFTTSDVGASTLGQQIAQLQAQQSSLRSQLASLQGQASQAGQQAAATQQQVNVTLSQLAQEQQQLNRANSALATTNDQIAVEQAQIVVDRSQLATLVTQMYQHGSADNLSTAIADSSGIAQFVDSTLQLQTVGQQFSTLTTQLLSEETALKTLQASQVLQQQQVSSLVASLQSRSAQLQSQEASFNQQASSLSGQAGQIASQIQQVASRIQTLQAEEIAVSNYGGSAGAEEGTILATYGPPSPPYGTSPDTYPWGQCTWFVATQTPVPWAPMGNADQWISEDASMGAYAWGTTPRAGSMVVFRPGGAYDPYYGHVAWVVAVVSPTTFIVKEANFIGFGAVDEREIYTLQGVEGFIYG
ncbi:MAG TPA: CHAP domain-containing protein [Candidatus Nanopelagicaceae bacterium]|nr:CHAP domain-containing protein [Candidatus Nanopelagicaceae bacterium]